MEIIRLIGPLYSGVPFMRKRNLGLLALGIINLEERT
jgi:hypothetical protein